MFRTKQGNWRYVPKDGEVVEETLTRDEKAQYQGATHDKNVAELLDMADEMNKRPESNEGSKDLPSGLYDDGSQQAAATPVSLPTR